MDALASLRQVLRAPPSALLFAVDPPEADALQTACEESALLSGCAASHPDPWRIVVLSHLAECGNPAAEDALLDLLTQLDPVSWYRRAGEILRDESERWDARMAELAARKASNNVNESIICVHCRNILHDVRRRLPMRLLLLKLHTHGGDAGAVRQELVRHLSDPGAETFAPAAHLFRFGKICSLRNILGPGQAASSSAVDVFDCCQLESSPEWCDPSTYRTVPQIAVELILGNTFSEPADWSPYPCAVHHEHTPPFQLEGAHTTPLRCAALLSSWFDSLQVEGQLRGTAGEEWFVKLHKSFDMMVRQTARLPATASCLAARLAAGFEDAFQRLAQNSPEEYGRLARACVVMLCSDQVQPKSKMPKFSSAASVSSRREPLFEMKPSSVYDVLILRGLDSAASRTILLSLLSGEGGETDALDDAVVSLVADAEASQPDFQVAVMTVALRTPTSPRVSKTVWLRAAQVASANLRMGGSVDSLRCCSLSGLLALLCQGGGEHCHQQEEVAEVFVSAFVHPLNPSILNSLSTAGGSTEPAAAVLHGYRSAAILVLVLLSCLNSKAFTGANLKRVAELCAGGLDYGASIFGAARAHHEAWKPAVQRVCSHCNVPAAMLHALHLLLLTCQCASDQPALVNWALLTVNNSTQKDPRGFLAQVMAEDTVLTVLRPCMKQLLLRPQPACLEAASNALCFSAFFKQQVESSNPPVHIDHRLPAQLLQLQDYLHAAALSPAFTNINQHSASEIKFRARLCGNSAMAIGCLLDVAQAKGGDAWRIPLKDAHLQTLRKLFMPSFAKEQFTTTVDFVHWCSLETSLSRLVLYMCSALTHCTKRERMILLHPLPLQEDFLGFAASLARQYVKEGSQTGVDGKSLLTQLLCRPFMDNLDKPAGFHYVILLYLDDVPPGTVNVAALGDVLKALILSVTTGESVHSQLAAADAACMVLEKAVPLLEHAAKSLAHADVADKAVTTIRRFLRIFITKLGASQASGSRLMKRLQVLCGEPSVAASKAVAAPKAFGGFVPRQHI